LFRVRLRAVRVKNLETPSYTAVVAAKVAKSAVASSEASAAHFSAAF
jgi:hypothetical protein